MDNFKVVWFADTYAQMPAELDYLRDDVIAELIGTEAAFGVTAGDVVFDDLLPSEIPVVTLPGL